MSMKRKNDIKHEFCVLRSWLEEITKLTDIEEVYPEDGVTELQQRIIDELYVIVGTVEALAKIILRMEKE